MFVHPYSYLALNLDTVRITEELVTVPAGDKIAGWLARFFEPKRLCRSIADLGS